MRTGSDHRTIPAKIFVENLNCPELTASFLAGAKDLWRIQKTACLLLPPLLYLGSSGQFPEWLTFDVSDPKVLRGDHKGTPLRVLGAPSRPSPPSRHSWPTARRQGHPALVVTHHDGPGDHFADHRLAFGLFRRRLTLWGPLAPCSSLCCRTSHEHLSGTIGKAISLAAV